MYTNTAIHAPRHRNSADADLLREIEMHSPPPPEYFCSEPDTLQAGSEAEPSEKLSPVAVDVEDDVASWKYVKSSPLSFGPFPHSL